MDLYYPTPLSTSSEGIGPPTPTQLATPVHTHGTTTVLVLSNVPNEGTNSFDVHLHDATLDDVDRTPGLKL